MINHWHTKAAQVRFESTAFIQGDYSGAGGEVLFTTENPATQQALAEFYSSDAQTIDAAVRSARTSFRDQWKTLAPDKRKALLLAVADLVDKERDTLALFDTLEMGMPITMAQQQVDSAASLLRYNAEYSDKRYGEVAPVDSQHSIAISVQEPRGVVAVIAPWNFPLLTAMYAIAPALAAGNTLVVKPSEQTPSSVLRFAQLAVEAGLPAGVLNVVPGLGHSAGQALASHCDIDFLHFTGSVAVGRQLMLAAGQSHGKPIALELGGKSPQIVCEDANGITGLGAALAEAAFYNSGQLCVAKSRLLVHQNIKQEILAAIQAEIPTIFTPGDPLDEKTSYGPMASRQHYQRVNDAIAQGEKEGATPLSLWPASEMPGQGLFIPPVIFDDGDASLGVASLASQEIFGPVLSVSSFSSDSEAIALANQVDYGLSASVWTASLVAARRFARDLNAGEISIASTTTSVPAPLALSAEPYGISGYGVMGGRRGLDTFSKTKAVQWITE